MTNETAVRIHSAKHAKLLFCSFFLEERKNKEKFVALDVHPAKLYVLFFAEWLRRVGSFLAICWPNIVGYLQFMEQN